MYDHWFISRQKRKLTPILPALIAYNDVCVGKVWNPETQEIWEDEIAAREITRHGNLRARRAGQGGGGIRTLFKQMQDLGLVFIEDANRVCRMTLIAEELVRGTVTFVEAMRMQLRKLQYPSAARYDGSGAVGGRFSVHPFLFILRLLKQGGIDNYITMDELAYIIIHEADKDDNETVDRIASKIRAGRATEDVLMGAHIRAEITATPDMDRVQLKAVKDKIAHYQDIANTFANYLELTQYIDRGTRTISIRAGKETDVDQYIKDMPRLMDHPELKENYVRRYGVGYSKKDLRDFSHIDDRSNRAIMESRIRSEYVLLALRTPITSITSDIVRHISERTGIDERKVENFLTRTYPQGNIDDFFVAYRELARSGTEGARDFEAATCEVFKKVFHMRADHIGQSGSTPTPDVFVVSEEKEFCGIIDNKAYKNGYSITGDHKRVMVDEYIPKYRSYGNTSYPLAFFSYIAGSFGSTINRGIQQIQQETGVNGSAMPVELFINMAQDYAHGELDHGFIRSVFSVNREVRLEDIQH